MSDVAPSEISPSDLTVDVEETMTLESDAFEEGELIAQRYTCDGTETSPPLRWADVPDGTAELVLFMEDLDGPDGIFVQWMVAGLEPTELGAVPEGGLPEGAVVGLNDFGDAAYKGPCPTHDDPSHQYRFTLVAAGAPLGLTERFDVDDLISELDAAPLLAKGLLTAHYGRQALSGPNPPTHGG